jgi:MEMO1 family protein
MKTVRSDSTIRPAAVAGLFYPDDPGALSAAVEAHLGRPHEAPQMPKAVIVPHAGYIYSGPTAGKAYASLGFGARSLRRVVLLGPCHRTWFRGLALPSVGAFETPLGAVAIEQASVGELRRLPAVLVSDEPHAQEHSLEVQLPFIQHVAPDARIVPAVAGLATPAEVGALIDAMWDDSGTLIVVSSDLSHYNSYETARAYDTATAQAILDGREDLEGQQACGCVVINGLSHAIRKRGLRAELLDLRNSGDTAGDKARVVGYGAFGFYDA